MKKGQFAMHKLDFHSTGAGSIAKRRHSGRRQATSDHTLSHPSLQSTPTQYYFKIYYCTELL